ncbi:MAG TPA: ribonuclease HI family protein [Myxococcales bacterium]|nr:ribonuclease HI family protein [Myxococcales bacterium]
MTPAQLLLAIAEHESLEKTCAALPGLTREGAQKLLRGAAQKLLQETLPGLEKPAAPKAEASLQAGRVVRVYSDGAARGNPGPAGAGAVLTDGSGKVLARLGRYLGRQTNNVAEYQGLLLGLQHAKELGYREVEVRADSQLLIRQLKGEYAVRHAGLKPLHAEALRLLRGFDRYHLQHVPREENALADEMSNRAIDEEMR